MEHRKVQSVAKVMIPRGPKLTSLVAATVAEIAELVGCTLGPGGQVAALERPEYGLPPTVTKDGVTVMRALGFRDSTQQVILEVFREVATRTAAEAGDGTTTATVLGAAIFALVQAYCAAHRDVSPQQVVQELRGAYPALLEPELDRLKVEADPSTPEGLEILRRVALVSSNGDEPLADAVAACVGLAGDDGNVTIGEVDSKTLTDGKKLRYGYAAERVEGYPVRIGYEESCGKLAPVFFHPGMQQILYDKPIFVLYYGQVNDMEVLYPILDKLQSGWVGGYLSSPNVVVAATRFSDSVLATLAGTATRPELMNVVPLLIPNDSAQEHTQRLLLEDLQAVVGQTKLFDPVTHPLQRALLEDLGNLYNAAPEGHDPKWVTGGCTRFEMNRYRATVTGRADPEAVLRRADVLREHAESPSSELDLKLTQERLALLTGGLAKLFVIGSSTADVKERRDRADDAVCAVRGAVQHGALPGGGYALARLSRLAAEADSTVLREVLAPALLAPLEAILTNCGLRGDTYSRVLKAVTYSTDLVREVEDSGPCIYDALKHEFCNPIEAGILDSVPAVKDALRNALSVASVLGTLGALVAIPRDDEFERAEAAAANDFLRAASREEPA